MAKKDITAQEATDLIPADIMDELIANAGAGLSTAAEDNIIPFLVLLQDMSPEVKKRDPNYVDGAEAGMYLNKATQQLYAGDAAMAERTGFPMLEFQHCELNKAIIEWVPRTDGGGFIARHPLQGTVEDTMKAIGAKRVPDPQDPNKVIWKTGDGTHDLIETRYHFGNIINEDIPRPAVLAYSSTGHTTSRQWMTLMTGFKTAYNGKMYDQPGWFHRYIIGSKARENKKGSFFVGTVDDGGLIADAMLRAAGKALHDAAKAGIVTAAAEPSSGDSVSNEI
jgi:hypothetical protein